MEPVISVKDLKKSYGNHSVLNGISFEVERGSIFSLLGENGAGKTTTVHILSTLISANSGTALISGYDTRKDVNDIKKRISLTGQYAAVDELLTGKENLIMMGRLSHLDRKTVKERTDELLHQFDLVSAANKPVRTYSGGMRRRLDIAISLLASPEVIFLDEPTTGLDPRSRKNMWELIQDLSNKGVTIFLTTQYLEEADQLADKIAILNEGKIVEQGPAETLKKLMGEEKLEISFAGQKENWLVAKQLLAGKTDENNLTILVPLVSVNNLRQQLQLLHENGIEPASLNFRKPTLDDVFMEITKNNLPE
ncbi:ATP-binding cassette domain-containing protein [Oceanobacillus jeddahense]|uniref:ATP-binding cassette domain-containing protein n=1 Tax=Oceanobacillus jeddahense TaxID=1462527 RepID=UPI0030B899B7